MHTAVQCFDIDTNDDRILHCCLVYKQKTVNTGKDRTVLVCGGDILWFLDKVVLLFTNDTNLCSKALVCNVAVGNRKVTYSLLISLFSTHFLFLHSSWYFTTSFPFLAHSRDQAESTKKQRKQCSIVSTTNSTVHCLTQYNVRKQRDATNRLLYVLIGVRAEWARKGKEVVKYQEEWRKRKWVENREMSRE